LRATPDVAKVIKSPMMRWAGHVGRTKGGETQFHWET